MARIKRTRRTMDDLHSRTMALANDAIAIADDFLAYLYTVALQHIEERLKNQSDTGREAGMSGVDEMTAPSRPGPGNRTE